MTRIERFVLTMLIVVPLSAGALPGAASAQQPEKRIALVVGNGAYAKAPLPTAANDAALVAQTLQAAGFDVAGARDLDGDTLRKSLREFMQKAHSSGPGTVAMIYLAGYGLQLSGENSIVPVDFDITEGNDIASKAVRLGALSRELAAIPLKAGIVVLDAARTQSLVEPRATSGPGLAKVEADANTLIAFNAVPGTVAPEEAGPYGVYAQSLAEMIRRGGLSLPQVFDGVTQRVNAASKGMQVPWYEQRVSAPFTFFELDPDAPPRADGDPPSPDLPPLSPPLPPAGRFVLPHPMFVPLPPFVRVPDSVTPPPNNIIFQNSHNATVVETVINRPPAAASLGVSADSLAPAVSGRAAPSAPMVPKAVSQRAALLQLGKLPVPSSEPRPPLSTAAPAPGAAAVAPAAVPAPQRPEAEAQPAASPVLAPASDRAGASEPTEPPSLARPDPERPATRPGVAPDLPSEAKPQQSPPPVQARSKTASRVKPAKPARPLSAARPAKPPVPPSGKQAQEKPRIPAKKPADPASKPLSGAPVPSRAASRPPSRTARPGTASFKLSPGAHPPTPPPAPSAASPATPTRPAASAARKCPANRTKC